MVSSFLMGGLGNILFQISTGYSYSLEKKIPFHINKSNITMSHTSINQYTTNILKNLQFTNLNMLNIYAEPNFHFNEIPSVSEKTLLKGYFQSEKYFIKHRKELLKFYEIDNITLDFILKKYGEIIKHNTCSIHVRRGDYLNLPDHHPVQSIEYYEKSIEIIGKENYFLIFSDDIKWCINNFDFIEKKIFIQNNFDYQDLYLMSMCKNNIICNSTFSWWGSWLNTNENKKVIAPSKWFGTSYSHLITNDLYCDNWIII